MNLLAAAPQTRAGELRSAPAAWRRRSTQLGFGLLPLSARKGFLCRGVLALGAFLDLTAFCWSARIWGAGSSRATIAPCRPAAQTWGEARATVAAGPEQGGRLPRLGLVGAGTPV